MKRKTIHQTGKTAQVKHGGGHRGRNENNIEDIEWGREYRNRLRDMENFDFSLTCHIGARRIKSRQVIPKPRREFSVALLCLLSIFFRPYWWQERLMEWYKTPKTYSVPLRHQASQKRVVQDQNLLTMPFVDVAELPVWYPRSFHHHQMYRRTLRSLQHPHSVAITQMATLLGFEHWPLSKQCQETLHDPSTLYQVHLAVVGRQEKRLAIVTQLHFV